MDKDRKRRPPGGVRLLQLRARVLLDTLSLVERQIAEFEAEAIRLRGWAASWRQGSGQANCTINGPRLKSSTLSTRSSMPSAGES